MQVKSEDWETVLEHSEMAGKAAEKALTDAAEVKAENERLRERLEALEAEKSGGGSISSAEKRRQSDEVKGFLHYVRTGDRTHVQKPDTKTISMASAAAGGALVPEQIANTIVNRAIARSRLASIVRTSGPFTSDYVRILGLRGTSAAWAAETGTRNAATTPTFREVRPTHGELYSYPAFSRWSAEDAQFNVQAYLNEQVSDEFAKSLENAILLGSGTNQPTGILDTATVTTTDDASPLRDADAIQYITDTNSPADLASAIIDLYFSVKPEYRARGSFVMSSSTLAAVRKLRDADGSGFLWQVNLSQGVDAPDGMLLNRPVVLSEYMPAMGASPLDDAIMFGDFDVGYELVRIGGMVMIRDEVTTPGTIKLYIAQRWGGRLIDNDALKTLRV